MTLKYYYASVAVIFAAGATCRILTKDSAYPSGLGWAALLILCIPIPVQSPDKMNLAQILVGAVRS